MHFFSEFCSGFPANCAYVPEKRCAFKLCFQMYHAGSNETAASGHSCHACLLLECMAFLPLGIPARLRNVDRKPARTTDAAEQKPKAKHRERQHETEAALPPNPLFLLVNCLFFLLCHSDRWHETGTAAHPAHFFALLNLFYRRSWFPTAHPH